MYVKWRKIEENVCLLKGIQDHPENNKEEQAFLGTIDSNGLRLKPRKIKTKKIGDVH